MNYVMEVKQLIITEPGALVIFPGYLEHEFAVDYGKDPFRFIHFNIMALPKGAFNK